MLKKSILAALALSVCFTAGSFAGPIPESAKVGGEIAIGCQAWSFRLYTAMEAIEKTEKAGGKIIELFPGQHLSKEDKTPVGPGMSNAQINLLKEKLEKCKVSAVNFGVTGIPNTEPEARKLFEFAKKLDLYAITTESTGSIDVIEKLAKEYDIRVGFHNHPRRPNNPNYKVWNPKYIRDLVKDRDARLGAAADIGHWATDGQNAVDALRILEGRVVSVHAKDREKFGEDSRNVAFGAGVLNMTAVLDELKRQKFAGNISIEFESNWDKSVPEIAQSVGFVRGYVGTKGK